MKTKVAVQIIILFLLISIVTFIAPLYAQEYSIVQITNHNDSGRGYSMDNGQVVWEGPSSSGYGSEIFLYDGSKTIQLTNDNLIDRNPQIHEGKVVWQKDMGVYNTEIFLYDGKDIYQLTNNDYSDTEPKIYNGQVVWTAEDIYDSEIFFYNGSSTIQLTNNNYSDRHPIIHNGNIVWMRYDGDGDIFLYNGTDIVQLTSNNYDDYYPQVHNGQVVWYGNWDIFFYNGSSTIQLTNNNYIDTNPQIHNGKIVWSGYDGINDNEIYLYDGANTVQLTNNIYNDEYPYIENNRVVWQGWDGNDWEIFLYDGTNIIQITDNDYWDVNPKIQDGKIIWYKYDSSGYEIFLATPVKWPVTSSGSFDSSPSISDLNGDKNLDILVGGRGRLYNLNNNGEELWSVNLGYKLLSPPTVSDLNNDSEPEILIEDGEGDNLNGGNLYCLNKKGTIIWQYAFGTSTYSHYGYVSPIASDLDNDGNLEIIAGENDKYLYCIDKNGQLIWKYETDYSYLSSPAIADLDGDGNLEILVRSYQSSSDEKLYCIDKDGRLLWKSSIGWGDEYNYPVVADLDGDGSSEILVGSQNKYLYCFDRNGQLAWRYQAGLGDYGLSSPAIADLDGDGNLEVVFLARDSSSVYCLNKNGELIWKLQNNQSYSSVNLPSPVIADLDNDGYLEVLVGAIDFRCIDRSGNLLWKYEFSSWLVDSSPVIADLDGDGYLEIMFVHESDLYCLNKDGQTFVPSQSTEPIVPMPWPMFQHDLRRTGLYDRTPPTTPVVNVGGPFINHTDTWHADWQSEEKESDIVEYRWKITQDSSEGEVIRDWLSIGRNKFGSADNLALVDGKTYFACVQAKNTQGMWSEVGLGSATVDITAPTTTISGIDSLWHNLAVTVTLAATDSVSGVDYTYYSTDNFITGNTYQSPFIISADGVYTIKYYSLDKAGNVEAVKTAANQVKIDKTPPRGKVEINNNVTYAKSTYVTLNLSAKDKLSGMGSDAQMQFSNDGITYTTPESYNPTKSWTLTSGNGTKTVYVKFKDVAGNWSSSVIDTIILKEKRPVRWGFLTFPWLRR